MSRPVHPDRPLRRRTIPTLRLVLLFGGACWRIAAAGPGEPTLSTPEPPAAAPAPGSTPDGVKSDVAPPVRPATRPRIVGQHRTLAEAIDANVQRVSRGLNLDPSQQEKLRQILWDQHREMRAGLVENPQPGVDRAALTSAILENTKDQIRAMLNNEQRSKYSGQVPRELAAPSRADLEHWVEVQNGGGQPRSAQPK